MINHATGDDFVLFLKELVMPDGQRRPYSMWLSGEYPRVMDGLCKALSLDMRVYDPAWIGMKLRKLLNYGEPNGSFMARTPGSDKAQTWPSTIAYLAQLMIHRYAMLGILTEAGLSGGTRRHPRGAARRAGAQRRAQDAAREEVPRVRQQGADPQGRLRLLHRLRLYRRVRLTISPWLHSPRSASTTRSRANSRGSTPFGGRSLRPHRGCCSSITRSRTNWASTSRLSTTPRLAATFAGNALPDGAEPLAQAYAGHQFGGFSPQLGDGRALLLGEVIDRQGRRRDIAFKGSGRTPFARGGDGKAAVGPMLREVLIGEAMHALGIPTTRALAVAATGEPVYREQTLPGAVLTRVAASHLRVGTFEFYAARGDVERVRKLAEYTIARHDPALATSPQPFLALLRAVAERQAALIAQWMNVGFIHGVMNTDNMAISGETIDYGPCAFMEAYDPDTVFSSIDGHGRYAFGNQPDIANWNLARLAETLLPLLSDDPEKAVAMATEVLVAFPVQYRGHLLRGQRAKLGLRRGEPDDDGADAALAEDWLSLLHAERVDFTLGWRRLADAAAGDEAPLRALFADAKDSY